jgi:hypothetical protein
MENRAKQFRELIDLGFSSKSTCEVVQAEFQIAYGDMSQFGLRKSDSQRVEVGADRPPPRDTRLN